MDGDAERAVRMDGSIVVMVEFEGERDRDKKQREEEGYTFLSDEEVTDFQIGPPCRFWFRSSIAQHG